MAHNNNNNNYHEQKPFLSALTIMLSVTAVILSSIAFGKSVSNKGKIKNLESSSSLVSSIDREKESAKKDLGDEKLSLIESNYVNDQDIQTIINTALKQVDETSSSTELKEIVKNAQEQVKSLINEKEQVKLQEVKSKLLKDVIKETVDYPIYKDEIEVQNAYKDVEVFITQISTNDEDFDNIKPVCIDGLNNPI